jgi:hypothetical protein
MMMRVLTTLVIASAGVPARKILDVDPALAPRLPVEEDVCGPSEALKARRDTEAVRAIVGFATLFVFVVPFLSVSLGANAMIRDETSDRRYNRLLDMFEGDRPAFKAHLEDVCALDVSLEHLRDGALVTRPFALVSVIVGTVEVVAFALIMWTLCAAI